MSADLKQFSLFGSKENATSSLTKRTSAQPIKKSFPKIAITTGLSGATISQEGMLITRIVINQKARSLPNTISLFLKSVKREIDIKQGTLPLDLAVRDLLIES